MEFLSKYKLILLILLAVSVAVFFISRFFLVRHKGLNVFRSRKNFQVPTEGVKKMVLDNGMTLLMLKNDSQPKVLVQIAYNVGSYIEQEGERGLAHLLEHMIFKGTKKLSEGDIDEIARKYGATFNAFTSHDVTSYYFEVDKNNWKPFIDILADCMQNARFDEQHLASELKAVIQELKMYKDNYWSLMFEKSCQLLFPANHPYHYPVIGYKEDLMNISAEKLKAFYNKYYQPNRATLFVVGDIDHEEVIQEVKRHFESIQNHHAPIEKEFIHLPPALANVNVTLYEDVKSEQLGFFWRIPGIKDNAEVIGAAAARLLGGGDGSRLHRVLVDEKKVASSVSVYDYTFLESGIFLIAIEPLPSKSDSCKELVIQELQKAIQGGFEEKELEHMIKAEAKSFFAKLQAFASFAYEWIYYYFAKHDEYSFFNRVQRFTSITSQDIQTYLSQHIDPMIMNQICLKTIPQGLAKVSQEAKQLSDELDKKILSKYVRTTPVEEPQYAQQMPDPARLQFTFPKPDRYFTLPNGLTVLLRKNSALPLISLDCKFKEFFYLQTSNQSPAVDLMMNALIEESTSYSKRENVDFFDFYGVDYQFDAEGARLSLLSADVDVILERFVHILAHPTFNGAAVAKLKTISKDNFIRLNDDPKSIATRLLKSKMYARHPFGWTYEEALSLLDKTDVSALKKLHKQLVTPNNMVLAVAGDIDLDEMQSLITKVFGKWERGEEFNVSYPSIEFVPRDHVNRSMVRDQVVLMMGQPSNITIAHPDLVPLKVLNYIVFHSLGSRLYKLREQSGLFYTAFGGWASGVSKEKGFDFLGSILNPDKVDHAEKEMCALIDEVGKHGVEEDELAAARQLYLKTMIDSVSRNSSVAHQLAMLKAWDLGFDYYDKVLNRVQTIQIEELNRVAAQYFKTDNVVRVRVGRV